MLCNQENEIFQLRKEILLQVVYPESCQTSKMERFVKIVKDF